MHQRDEFDARTKSKLAGRAGYLCSNPHCNTLTIGPSESDPESRTNIGRASHIHAASENGPRYSSTQTTQQRKAITNGIWLCANCADLIDKNGGIDYTADLLHKWKSEHEKMIRYLLKKGTSPLPIVRNKSREGDIAQQILATLDNRGALFMEPPYERNPYVISSLAMIREELTALLRNVDSDSPLYNQIRTITEECRKYMNEMSNEDDFDTMAVRLLTMRKAIGIVLKYICQQYSLLPPPNLVVIMPKEYI